MCVSWSWACVGAQASLIAKHGVTLIGNGPRRFWRDFARTRWPRLASGRSTLRPVSFSACAGGRLRIVGCRARQRFSCGNEWFGRLRIELWHGQFRSVPSVHAKYNYFLVAAHVVCLLSLCSFASASMAEADVREHARLVLHVALGKPCSHSL